MLKKDPGLVDRIQNFFVRFEQVLTVIVVIIIAIIIGISVIRIVENLYTLFALDFFEPADITFQDYQLVFGKILTLLISLEFMTSILRVLKTHKIKTLTKDVVLITALAVSRKLIIYDYDHADPIKVIVLGGVMVSIGVFYFLISVEKPAEKPHTEA